jgi:uncharacterized membrane protein (UPF0127 family)
MRRFVLATTLLVLAAAACSWDDRGATVELRTAEETTTVDIEVADTPEERQRGLSGRDELDADAGMLFVFGEPVTQTFWMKDTRIPLSIAFIDADGRIVAIRDMIPCPREPCRLYSAGKLYSTALEVNRGAFRRWGVAVGDTVRVKRAGD